MQLAASPRGPSELAVRVRGPVAVAGAGAAFGAALLVHDPHEQWSWGGCPFLLLTGVPCPGCGGLRAAADLLHGHLAEAVSSNLYAVVTAVAVLLGLLSWTGCAVAGLRPAWGAHSERVGCLWLAGLLLFGVLRLLPPLAWLQP